MCGRYSLAELDDASMRQLELLERPPEWRPHFNIAPTVSALIIRSRVERDDARGRQGAMARFGVDRSRGPAGRSSKLINVRSEDLSRNPLRPNALLSRRCLVPADGFFEWKRATRAGKTYKQPYRFQLSDRRPLAFAGVWWPSREATEASGDSFAILTTRANDLVASVHDRMPVILSPQSYATWLDPEIRAPEQLAHLFEPVPASQMTARPLSLRVNNAKYDDAACLEEIEELDAGEAASDQ